MSNMSEEILDQTAADIAAELERKFEEAKRNLPDCRPVAEAAAGLLEGSLDVASEIKRIIDIDVDLSQAPKEKPVLLVASKFGTWASELTLVAGTLLKAGYHVVLASEDGSVPHLLGPSMVPGTSDGAWRFSVVSEEERDLALRFLNPDSDEHRIFRKENIVDLSRLARPPQVGDYLKEPELLDEYKEALRISLDTALDYSAVCVAGGSGAIPGLMFDRGLHSLLFAFYRLGKPIMGECNGGLAILQTLDPVSKHSILYGHTVTTHSSLDEYQSEWGWTLQFEADTDSFWKNGRFDIDAYCSAEKWCQPGTGGNPLIDSEGYFRDAAGPEGLFFSPPGSAYSVVLDEKFITCRTTPDGYPGALALIALLNGTDKPDSPLFIDSDAPARRYP
jgi:putative intracellular protease/amidase